jgi:hypothetical protein
MPLTEVRTVLGDARPVAHTYGDGSVTCPYCTYPIGPDQTSCPHPYCDANPHYSPARLSEVRAERQAKQEREERERRDREWVAAFAKQRADEHRQRNADALAECRARGCCELCLFAPGWERYKFVKHRDPSKCPKRRR